LAFDGGSAVGGQTLTYHDFLLHLNSGPDALDNIDNTITGNGSIGVALTNETGGLIEANSGQQLSIGPLVNNGLVEAHDGGRLIAVDVIGSGTISIGSASTVEVKGTIGAGETIAFSGTSALLQLDDPGDMSGTATTLAQDDTIDLRGIDPGSVSYAGGVLSFTAALGKNASFRLALADPADTIQIGSDNSGGADITTLCFCVGTLILTPNGEVPVECLAVGDLAVTHSGEARPIVWIGVGRVLATRGRRTAATPVIVRKGAIADNVPHGDLRVTKGHSLFVDDSLIPVEFLVNHRSIIWDDRAQEVELYHIELAQHDIMIANGAPAESYRDDGNRWLFRNANSGWDQPPKSPFAPVLTGGPIVDVVWRRLLDRAGPRPGVPMTDDSDLHLLVDGRRVDAVSRGGVLHIFRLAAQPLTVRIVSRTGVPQELGLARDPRCLGVALLQIMVTQGVRIRTIEAGDALLAEGFHGFEADNGIRWTDGDAAMPEILFDGFGGPLEIVLHVSGSTTYVDQGSIERVA
jgi:hypothetical protein